MSADPPKSGVVSPPSAKRIPREETLHGELRIDDYFWMREKDSPDVLSYLRSENAFTEAAMRHTEPLQEDLYREMLARIKETDLSVPYRLGGYLWYSRTEEGKQYPIHCRRKGSFDAPEEVTLDLNEMGKGESYIALGSYVVSDDGRHLAYTLDTTGFRLYTLFIKDLVTGEIGPERIERVDSVAWCADGRTLFYVTEDDAKRPSRLHRHTRGAAGPNAGGQGSAGAGPVIQGSTAVDPLILGSAIADPLIYEETDEMFGLSVSRTRSRAYIVVSSNSHTTSEVRVLPASTPEGAFRMIAPRASDHEYDVDHRDDLFYIRTNREGRRNFSIVTAPVDDPEPERWREVVPHRDDVMLEGIDLFRSFNVLFERAEGLQRVVVEDLASGRSDRIEFPEPVYSVFPGANPEFDAETYRYSYQSFTTPPSVYEYEVRARESRLLKQEEVLGGYDPALYASERLHAVAADGARIPISLVYRKGAPRKDGSPMLLYGYGSYGYALPVGFASMRMSLLDRGVVFAIAHVRGGGEMGKRWHDEGRMMAKRNTFTDFIAAAEFLVERRWTAQGRLVIGGGSAGGLLVGAVLNMRPELFAAAVLQVPFVDVINTMLDTSLPLTVGEFEEWGNPRIHEHYVQMRSYSPYDNVESKDYPAMLVLTSYNDSQVMYWEPAKYVAKLRAMKTDANPLLFKINMDPAGHGGRSGRYDRLREIAFEFAFILDRLGLAGGRPSPS